MNCLITVFNKALDLTRRISKNHQRVDMMKIKNARNIKVTFSSSIVVFSPDGKVFSFFHPSMDMLVDRFLGRTSLYQITMNLEVSLQMEKNWCETPIEELNLVKLQHLKNAFKNIKKKVEKEAEMVNNNASLLQTLGGSWIPPNCST
uniref:MADS-box domain-containing protein n=1 Tax=Solanum lycopersicum TaxID=4081 RepID=A0A3Q7G1H5_SOLLC